MTINKQDPNDWYEEREAAIEFADMHRKQMDEIRRQAFPGHFGVEIGPGVKTDHEAVAHGMMSWGVPQLVWDDAKVDIQSPIDPEEAAAVQATTNNWIVSEDLIGTLTPVARDYLLMAGVTATTLRSDPGLLSVINRMDKPDGFDMKDAPESPVVERLPLEAFFADPAALTMKSAEYQGHDWVQPLEALLEAPDEDGWREDELRSAASDRVQDDRIKSHQNRRIPGRDVVHGTQIWVPGMRIDKKNTPEDGYNGAILTLARSDGGRGGGEFIREPIDFYGPPTGPYTYYGIHDIPNTPYSTSTIACVMPSIRKLNDVRDVILEAVQNFRQGMMYEAANEKLARALNDAPRFGWVGVRGLLGADGKPQVAPYKIGGPAPELYSYLEDLKLLVDRYTGQTDRERGLAAGGETATASALASTNADIRMAWVKSQWVRALSRQIRTVSWYIACNKRTAMPIPSEDPTGMALYVGGTITPAEFERLHLRISPYSSEMADEGTRSAKAIQVFGLIMQVVPLIAQFPMLPWGEMLDWLGDSVNMPELGRFLPRESIQVMSQGLGTMIPPGTPGGAQPQFLGEPGPRPPLARRPQPGANGGLPGNGAGAQATKNFKPAGPVGGKR